MKKWLILLAVILIIPLAALTWFISTFDENRIKSLIIEQVAEHTGRTLKIDGPLSWTFFPSVGFEIEQVSLQNPRGFSGNHIEIGRASLSVAVKPLLEKRIEVGELLLLDTQVNIITNAEGQNNLDDLVALSQSAADTDSPSSPKEAPSQQEDSGQPYAISVEAIRLGNGRISYQNNQEKAFYDLTDVDFNLERFEPGSIVPAHLYAKLTADSLVVETRNDFNIRISPDFRELSITGFDSEHIVSGPAVPRSPLPVKLAGDFSYDIPSATARGDDMAISLDDLVFTGRLQVDHKNDKPAVDIGFHTSLLDLDAWMPEQADTEVDKDGDSSSPSESSTDQVQGEPDLSGLQAINLKGQIQADKVIAQKMEFSNADLQVSITDGIARLDKFGADFYEGTIAADAMLNGNSIPAAYGFNADVKGVQIRPILKVTTDNDLLGGVAALNIALNGHGLTEQAVMTKLTGPVEFSIKDGAVYGINIPQMYRDYKATISGQPREKVEKKTDFSSLNGSLLLGNGLARLEQFSLQSPLLRVAGQGTTDLKKQTLDMKFISTLVSSLEGQDSKELVHLVNVPVPLDIRGTWSEPKFELDIQALLEQQLKTDLDTEKKKLEDDAKQQLEKEINKELDKHLDDDTKEEVKNMLKGLF